MSIAATANSYANSYYDIASAMGAATSGAGASASSRGSLAAIVEALARILQTTGIDSSASPTAVSPAANPTSTTAAPAATTAASSANSSATIILTQLSALAKLSALVKQAAGVNESTVKQLSALTKLASELLSANTVSANAVPTNGKASMELNLNQLLNSSVLQKFLTQLPPELLSKPQVIQALVLQNTLLPATTSKEPPALPLLNLPSGTPASTTANPSASTTLYRVNIEWQNKLIQILSPQPLPTGTRVPLQIDARGAITLLRPEVAAKILAAQTVASAANISQATQPNAPSIALTPTPAQTIQQSLRELLPRQQALHTLVPLLQKFITPAVREQLPPPITKALAQLLQSLPKPAQLKTAENVKQAIGNSGSFLEAKIANAATAAPGAEPLPKIASTDIKAQVAALLALIREVNPNAAMLSATKNAAPQNAAQFAAEDEFVYTKPVVQHLVGDSLQTNNSDSLDSLLTQLGKLLQSGFARIQLNQLDSVNARHINHETQTPVPTWVLELPLRTQHGVDQLQLRIEQHRKQQQQRTRVQWNVELAFDLHKAGKIAASLAIVDNSVAATLWAEQEKTHLRVREEMDFLRVGLESVGVRVTEMQCRLGLPAPRSNPISQQLVDVHT